MFEHYIAYWADELRTNTGLVALLSIVLTGFINIIIQHFSKELELKKHRQQLLFEKKYNAYAKYFEYFDDYFRIAQDVLIAIKQFNNEEHKNEDEFEKAKKNLLITFEKFTRIKGYLEMPGVEISMFFTCNNKIEEKVMEIVSSEEYIINPSNSFEVEKPKLEKHIKILSDLAQLLKEDLGMKN